MEDKINIELEQKAINLKDVSIKREFFRWATQFFFGSINHLNTFLDMQCTYENYYHTVQDEEFALPYTKWRKILRHWCQVFELIMNPPHVKGFTDGKIYHIIKHRNCEMLYIHDNTLGKIPHKDCQ